MLTGSPRSVRRAFFRVAALVLASGAVACGSDAAGANFPELHDIPSAPPKIREAAAAVVRVGTAFASGTGSFISASGRMMTNNHVLGADVCPVEGCWIEVSFEHQLGKAMQEPRSLFAVPEHVDVGMDLSVVQLYEAPPAQGGGMVSTPAFLTFEPLDAPSLVGMHITIVGHPRARLKKWSDGVVVDATGSWFECTNFILPGDSGSPVLNDAGHIVGLIHRGSSSASDLNADSVLFSSLGTASASLVQALDAPLPAVMVSTQASVSAGFVVQHNEAYLNAHAATALVDGVKTDVLTLLGDACDAALTQDGFTSPEELSSVLTPCSDAQSWIECRREDIDSSSATVCPADQAARDAWAHRYQQMNDRSVALTGELDLSSISFGMAALASSDGAGDGLAASSLRAALDTVKPLRDFNLAPYQAAFNIETGPTTSLIRNYHSVPHYELYGTEIASAALWLNNQGALSRKDTDGLLVRLLDDPNIGLGTKLFVQDVRYNSGRQ
ncbi:MAG: hypothetical protein JWN48_3310 [Myxococcaceae bacterium]|nr:hypothetical protein [Myxococcaceae bacterium]